MKRLCAGIVVVMLAAFVAAATDPAGAATPGTGRAENPFAEGYHRLLLEHTRWSETTWDDAAGHYEAADFNFVNVLGNAVLLRFGDYDADVAGVGEDVLADRTLATIQHFAATNRWVDPAGQWGRRIHWDSTFEAYFIAAARLLWSELDEQTRDNVDTIARRGADYVAELGTSDDPLSGSWTTNGLEGGYRHDSKIEEMGTRTMPLATALAYLPDNPGADQWQEWLTRWTANMGGLPAADDANSALVDGRSVAEWNEAHNVYDTFVVENHGSYAPIYQESMGAYPGRNAAQFLIAGQPLPESLRRLPNGDELWGTLAHLGTDAGLSAHLMIADRHHLYGRDVLPLTYRTTVLGDRYAARAEQMLLDHLLPYLRYPPEYRLTKFTGEPKYEPEARAELAMAYLLHHWNDRLAGDVEPVSAEEFFTAYSGAVDYGADVGLIAQQSPDALAAAVSKPGYVKFAYMPQHDDWLFDSSGGTPSLMPSTSTTVTDRSAHAYDEARDGFDGSATLLTTPDGYAGFATLPTGKAVYATSGLGDGEGRLSLYNLTMPGVDGLDGDRTFAWAGGRATLAPDGGDGGDGGEDDIAFEPVTARYVRFVGMEPATVYGYSIWDFQVHDGDGPDLALGRPTTASSFDGPSYRPEHATDGDPDTRWAVARAERSRPDSWLTVDLGETTSFDRVRVRFEAAYAAAYRLQVSDDATTWRDVATVPQRRTVDSPWLNVDGRAGFVVRGSDNPISVRADGVTLSAGDAAGGAGMVVEARPAETAQATERAAAAPAPSGGPDVLRASLVDGYLSLFNLSAETIDGAALDLPQHGDLLLYRGVQETTGDGTRYEVDLDASDARIEPPRFRLSARRAGDPVPPLRIEVADSRTVTVENLADRGVARLHLAAADGSERPVTVPGGSKKTVVVGTASVTPTSDLARVRTTYPTSPLPAGMSDPDLAVDGDPVTSWQPGEGSRMVVDLGAPHELTAATLRWDGGRVQPYRIQGSHDGLSWTRLTAADGAGAPRRTHPVEGTWRYVAVDVEDWRPGDAALAELNVAGSDPVLVTGDGGTDEIEFASTHARHIRMLGVRPATAYGYSVFELEAFAPEGTHNLAAGQPTTASSYDSGSEQFGGPFPPALATDGDPDTRWAVAIQERDRADSWLAVDLGTVQAVDRVRIAWESAYGATYRIQTSLDGHAWRDVSLTQP